MKSHHYQTFGEEDVAKNVENGIGVTIDMELSSPHRQKIENRFTGTVSVGGLLLLFITMTITMLSYTNIKTSGNDLNRAEYNDKLNLVTTSTTTSHKYQPNFVFILADDLGYNSVGYEAHDLTSVAPYLTSLSKDGIALSNYYAQEVCTPSRAALMTGRYPISLGMQYDEVLSDSMWGLNTSEVLLPEVLRDFVSYKNYAIGKWNLGHYTPQMLPTARGFDQFIGFMNGENYYWSKRYPFKSEFTDFVYADADCHTSYEKEDLKTYSTFLYRDKAVQAIQEHSFQTNPMFLYLAAQAVHDPFNDIDSSSVGRSGIPKEYLSEDVYEYIQNHVVGASRQQYSMALNLLDGSVQAIVEALAARGQLDNTYIIFASDNGGCYQAGGRNGDLRGSKGSLFEGGVKVDSFIYSALLPSSSRGTVYSNIMHVSDWFPTILELAGVTDYSTSSARSLDGVSHASALLSSSTAQGDSPPRQYLLYNMYYRVENEVFDPDSNAPMAIRDARYKLVHSFANNSQTTWYSFDEKLSESDDTSLWSISSCPQYQTLTGDFTKFLFDLKTDPNERINLYHDPNYEHIKQNLYLELDKLKAKVVWDKSTAKATDAAESEWKKSGNYILPWDTATTTTSGTSSVSSSGYVEYSSSQEDGDAKKTKTKTTVAAKTKTYPAHCIPQHSLFA